ncbi:AMP-binding protein [Mesorhizobium sp. A623]
MAEDAERVALIEGERRWTFGQLWGEAAAVCTWLLYRDIKRGDVVSYQLPNWYESVVLNLACAMGGFIVNPLVPIYRDREVGYMLADSRSRVLFIPSRFRHFDYLEMVRRIRGNCPELSEVVVLRGPQDEFTSFQECLAGPAAELPPKPSPDDVKLVLYTSGTTGRPKAVLHTHNTIMSEIVAVAEYWDVQPQDIVFMASPVSHITGYLYALEQPFILRSSAVLLDVWSGEEAARLIRLHGCTIMFGATPFLKELVDAVERSGEPLPSLRLFPCGGSSVPPQLVYRASKILSNCKVYRIYGATEVSGAVALGARCGDVRLAAETDGELWHCEAKIADPATGTELAPGQEGEILLRGPQTFIGYGDPRDDETAFDDEGFFRTGDLGKIDPPGFIVTTGRSKDLIIRGGENLSPREIEDLLVQHPAVQEVAVVAMPDERLGEAVCAFLVCVAGANFDHSEALRYLLECKLAKQKIPSRIELVFELPKTASGKVRKDILRAEAKSFSAPGTSPRAN